MLKALIIVLLSTALVLGAMIPLYKEEVSIMIQIGQEKLDQMLNGEKPDVTDADAKLETLALDTTGAKLVFDFAEKFTAEGLKVIATMTDGSKKEIPLEECKIIPADTTSPGTRQVVVLYEGRTLRYDVTVNLKVIPPISETSLVDIIESNTSYRVEAESIDMVTPGAKLESGVDSFVADAVADAGETSGNKYLTGYGVAWNYFGFTFTAKEEYKNSTLVLRVANSTAEDINAGVVKMYLNFSQDAEGVASGELPLDGYIIEAKGACNWSEIVIRNITIPAGNNTLTFEVQKDKSIDIDCIDFYVSKPYVKSIVEITDTTTVVKDLETLDTEKAFTRSDVANAHGLKDGQLFVEPVSKESPGKSTSGGTSVGAIGQGSQISTYLYLAQDSTVRIRFKASCVGKGSYYIADHWNFYIDGIKLITVELINIEGGDGSKGYWWDWIYTSVGDINLPAGYHSFILEVHGTDCNVDTVEFEAISLGSYAESGRGLESMHACTKPCPECGKCTNTECDNIVCAEKCKGHENVDPNFDITVSADTSYKFEAEKLDQTNLTPASGWEDRGVQVETPNQATPVTSGGKSLGACGGGYTTISIKLLDKATLQVIGRLAESKGGTASSLMIMSISGTNLVANGTLPAGDSNSKYFNWKDIPFGAPINLEAGEYTLTITFKTGVNLDCIKINALSYGEFAEIKCESICEICGKCTDNFCAKEEHSNKCLGHRAPDVVITDASNSYRLEAEILDTGNLVGDSKGVTVETFTKDGVECKGLGHISAGGYQTVFVTTDKDVTVNLHVFFAFATGGSILSRIPAITMNDENLTLNDVQLTPGTGTASDTSAYYWNVNDVIISTVELKAGVTYTFKFTINSGNLDAYAFEVVENT